MSYFIKEFHVEGNNSYLDFDYYCSQNKEYKELNKKIDDKIYICAYISANGCGKSYAAKVLCDFLTNCIRKRNEFRYQNYSLTIANTETREEIKIEQKKITQFDPFIIYPNFVGTSKIDYSNCRHSKIKISGNIPKWNIIHNKTKKMIKKAIKIIPKDIINEILAFVGYKSIYLQNENIKLEKEGCIDGEISFDWLSSGQEQVLCNWLFIFMYLYNDIKTLKETDKPRLILIFIDEPETNLHPEWQRTYIPKLTDLFKRCLESTKSNASLLDLVSIQCFISTHSPLILNSFRSSNSSIYTVIDEIEGEKVKKSTQKRPHTYAYSLEKTLLTNMGMYALRPEKFEEEFDVFVKNLQENLDNAEDEITKFIEKFDLPEDDQIMLLKEIIYNKELTIK